MEVRRTVPMKLDVDRDDAAVLLETVDEFLWTANSVVDHAWQGDYKTTSKAQLQEETYDDRDTPHSRYLDNDDYEVTGAELHTTDGEWFFHLRTKAGWSPTCRTRQRPGTAQSSA